MSGVLVNLGCGSAYHTAWRNFDVRPVASAVEPWNITHGLPLESAAADACYASHLLEHLRRQDALALIKECFRVLKSGGVIRIAVPDLEAIVRRYLAALERASGGDQNAVADYDWMLLEMLDQMVRAEPGGAMSRHLTGGDVKNPEFIIARIGREAEQLMRGRTAGSEKMAIGRPGRVMRLRHMARRLREEIAIQLCGMLLGRSGREAMREGLFRRSGEVHLWMYDRYSLRHALEAGGFKDVTPCTAHDSRIPGFNSYGLDVVDGRVRKPDSLFMEAVKP